MSKMIRKSGVVLALVALTATGALAQDGRRGGGTGDGGSSYWSFGFGGRTATPGIDREQAEQARDINRGVRSGALTQREADALRTEQARIADLERRAKADGRVTAEERQRIRSAQSAAERHIQEESRDRERAGGGRGYNGWRPWFAR